ncbi:MAG: anaerobic ribonucleoside-triphosphate reductase activating protein [Desulfobulbaceae bacterium]|nr:anaerobic ribonucleoside-triphosphate reductase activating protein [Desulfobulbaceae bacterium]
MLEIGGLLPFTTIDYPGNLAAVLFCQGCPWRCGYCHNRHLMTQTSRSPVYWHEVSALLRQRRGLLDALVFSGGEPTLQEELPDAIRAVRTMGFKVGLHTAGPYPERLRECIPLLDWVGMDLKAPFDEYERITGIPGSGAAAQESAMLLRQSGLAHQFRTTLDPFLYEGGRIKAMQQMVEGWGETLVLQQQSPYYFLSARNGQEQPERGRW